MERAALRDGGACRERQWSAERSMTAYGASERVWTEERGMQCGGERACVCFVESDREETRDERDELRVAGGTTVGEWREVVCDLVCDCDLRDEWVLFGLGLIESGHWFVR